MIGDIMTVSRLRMGTDGDGVSTLVSFFDCPLHCRYCINDFCHDNERTVFGSVPRVAYTPEQLVETLKKDDIYYKMSGGGIVFGGGEPLLQSAFIHEVCKLFDPEWKKRVETSLGVPWRCVEPIVEDIDEWIIDIKETNLMIYKKYTGIEIYKMRENILRLRDLIDASKLRIRIPKIPGFNTEKDVEKSAEWVRERIGIEPEIFEYIVTADHNNKK